MTRRATSAATCATAIVMAWCVGCSEDGTRPGYQPAGSGASGGSGGQLGGAGGTGGTGSGAGGDGGDAITKSGSVAARSGPYDDDEIPDDSYVSASFDTFIGT
jgi:hypothetical protein